MSEQWRSEDKGSQGHFIYPVNGGHSIGVAWSRKDAERIVAALAAVGEVERLRGVLRMLTISHRRVDGDPFYSCEIAKKQDADDPNDYPDARCDCGADHHNERIRKALFARPQEATAQGTGDSDE